MEPEAEWFVADFGLVVHHEKNIAASLVAYFFFAVLLIGCKHHSYMFRRRIADVLLMLIAAFITDLAKTRMHVYFLAQTPSGHHREQWVLPTSRAACTVGVWVLCFYFMTTFVDATVAIYRFVQRFKGRDFIRIFVGGGIVLGAQALFFFESHLRGKPTALDTHVMPMTCSNATLIEWAMRVNLGIITGTMLVAPILSLLMAFKKSRAQDRGVTAFIFFTSLFMAGFVILMLLSVEDYIPEAYRVDAKMALLVLYAIQDFRFPIMCLLALIFVADIREIVFATVSAPFRKLIGRKGLDLPVYVTNECFVDAESRLIH